MNPKEVIHEEIKVLKALKEKGITAEQVIDSGLGAVLREKVQGESPAQVVDEIEAMIRAMTSPEITDNSDFIPEVHLGFHLFRFSRKAKKVIS